MTTAQRGIAYVALCGIVIALGVLAAVRHDWFFLATDAAAAAYLLIRIRTLIQRSSTTSDG